MKSLLERAERVLGGTIFEPPARFVWTELSSLGHPRARQSAMYDRETHRIMRRVLDRDSNCVDVGAHRGSTLRWMLKLAPEGHHFAVEPIPRLAQYLRKHFPGVCVYELGLSDTTGEETFCHVVSNPGLSGLRRMGHVPPDARIEELKIRTGRLDELLPTGVRICFMKVDVEGAQLEVFRGAVRTIMEFRPYIVFEHGILAREAYGTTSASVYELLADRCGLRVSLLSDWLGGKSALTREAFDGQVGYHSGSHFCFLAHP